MLPSGFQFSQASLQDFIDCPKRFQLRYLMGLRWPAAESEPIEQHERRIQLGQAFHHLVQQHLAGISEERIARTIGDANLERWWRNYLLYRPVATYGGEAATVRSEVALLGAIGAYKLIAKYDVLIVHAGGRVVILDWKTSETRASERSLRDRLQTRIYPFLVVQAGASLNGGELLKPSDVEMVYWFPEHPDAPARFAYSARQYEDDGAYLHRLVERIAALDDDAYDLTDEAWRCAFCAYRSYCERGEKAGALDDLDEAIDLDLEGDEFDVDFEHAAEVEF